ncbi:NAD(P)H-dependent flavin oxidoreductase [Pollutibacter soli]|uniref:NAD(P)H-dependent flavin oxidoreductase n=1 Tax=Pollutibacter soli TaxID=3034157 RepID=UPI003013C315
MPAFVNRVTGLFGIEYPIVQAGMVWASGWELASAVSNAGGLGIIGSGSMYPEVLRQHIRKCRNATSKPFGVNIPLLYPEIEKHINIVIEEGVKIIFTSAGNPNNWTGVLKKAGVVVVHVIGSTKFAVKAESAGCDAVVAEGFEAGGHNGREETTTMVLVPMVKDKVKIPVIAAGGIATGRQMLAAMVLGAEGVQVGSRFVASEEASVHINFKNVVLNATEGDTVLSLKKIVPVRLLKNGFAALVAEAEARGADAGELLELLGKGRAKRGMFEGDLQHGELEIGQVSAMLNDILPAGQIVRNLWDEFKTALEQPLSNY